MFDRLWMRVWLAVFLATAVPLVAFIILGALLLQSSLRDADIAALGRQANLLSIIIEKQPPEDRVTVHESVESVGRTLAVFPVADAASHLDAAALAELDARGRVAGEMATPSPGLYAAVERGGEIVVLQRPYASPIIPWRALAGRIGLGALLAVACAVAASVLLARAVTRPIARVAQASRVMAKGVSPPPVAAAGPREVRDLTESFDSMSREIRRVHDAERAFLLSVTHELKTPVAAVRGFALGQQEGVIGPEMASEFILAESSRLERLVEDLLDLARMGQGRFHVRAEDVDLAELAESAVRSCEAAAAGLDTKVVMDAPGGSGAVGDPDRIVQVIVNLVENALRLNPAGGEIRVTVGPGRVAVADSGPGLDDDDLAHAFDRFHLYDRYRGRRPVGTGLGLALVRELVESMRGSVAVTNSPSGGAVFVVSLPCDAPSTPAGCGDGR